MTPWKQRFKNSTGAEIPPFGIVKLEGGARESSGELVPAAELSTASGEEALYVISDKAIADDGYGWCRSVSDPPFWVRYDPDDEPSAGDEVGSVNGETYVSTSGRGIVVLYVDSDKGLALCDVLRGGSDADGGFPAGTEDCDCSHCVKGVTIPDGTECCESLLTWSMRNPWLACADSDLQFEYAGADTWLTEEFDGPSCGEGQSNVYRWRMLPKILDWSFIELVLVTDNGCPQPCIVYARQGFRCQCDNDFSLDQPGKWDGVARSELSCKVCVKPVGDSHGGIDEDVGCGRLTMTPEEIPAFVLLRFTDTEIANADVNAACCDDIDVTAFNGAVLLAEFNGVIRTGNSLLLAIEYARDFELDGKTGRLTIRYYADRPSVHTNGCYIRVTLSYADCLQFSVSFTGGPDPRNTYSPLLPNVNCGGNWPPSAGTISLSPGEGSIADVGRASPTRSGACSDADCLVTPPAPADPSPGGCCIDGECFTDMDEALCGDFNGVWFADQDDCPANCLIGEINACCLGTDCFDNVGPNECAAFGGTFHSGVSCSAGVCVDATGACCRSDGSCDDDVTEADCQGAGEYWNGAGSVCGPLNCAQVGCCYRIGGVCTCVVISHEECTAVGGDESLNCISCGSCEEDGFGSCVCV